MTPEAEVMKVKPHALHTERVEQLRESWASPGREPSDYTSREGAMALKAKIEAYWRERGKNVMIALHNVGFHPAIRAARFDVRSDMVNGLPRNHSAASAPVAANANWAVSDDDLYVESLDRDDDDIEFK